MFFKMCLLTGYVHYTAWHNIYKLYAIGGMWLKRSEKITESCLSSEHYNSDLCNNGQKQETIPGMAGENK